MFFVVSQNYFQYFHHKQKQVCMFMVCHTLDKFLRENNQSRTKDVDGLDFPPSGPPSQQKQPTRINGQEIRFFTPVRRSVRIERASLRYPASLQDHDLCVASYNDLISEEDKERSEETDGETSPSADNTPMYVYRQNEALKDKVFVQLVCNDNVSP